MLKKIIILVSLLCCIMVPKAAFAIADSASSACVMDLSTGDIVFEKNSQERRGMASTTKIMTAVVTIENCNLDDILTVSDNAAGVEGSSAYLEAGQQLTVRDVLYGLMLNSGNDAAVALAEHVGGGDVNKFVDMMNHKAWEIGTTNTQFVNPNGLSSDYHYTTAEDLAKIARYAMKMDEFREIVKAKSQAGAVLNTGETLEFYNHNKLLTMYDGCIGLKTGYTEATGRCLVSAAQRDGLTLVAVTLNDPNDWNDHMEMLDYGFSQYYPREVIKNNQIFKTIAIDGQTYSFKAKENFVVQYKEGSTKQLDVITHIVNDLERPINAGEKVGIADVYCAGEWLGSIDIVSDKDIYSSVSNIRLKSSFFDSFLKVSKLWLL